MKSLYYQGIFVVGLIQLMSCSSAVTQKQVVAVPSEVVRTLSASGYSRFVDDANLSVNQRWLKAQQTAKLTADRALAAQIYQEPLGEQKTVASQVMTHELYRVYVDNTLRSAQAVDYHAVQDGLQVKMVLKLTSQFYQCLAGDVAQVDLCLKTDNKMPFTRIGYKSVTASTVSLACAIPDCAEQYSVQGFSREPSAVNDTLLSLGIPDSQWLIHTSEDLFGRLFFIQSAVHGF